MPTNILVQVYLLVSALALWGHAVEQRVIDVPHGVKPVRALLSFLCISTPPQCQNAGWPVILLLTPSGYYHTSRRPGAMRRAVVPSPATGCVFEAITISINNLARYIKIVPLDVCA